MTLLSPETCLAYADILEKPYRNVAGGGMHEPGEIARAAAAALRALAAARRERDALALQVLTLTNERDEARARSSQL